uniref:homeodomain-interacting protein kinase 2-like n=1 Tax=Semicossyphus pulcher TaxID=241346 RepID=UPI0037E883A1
MSTPQPAQWLASRSTRYLVQSVLGQGTFGTVAKCIRMTDKETVAVKMMIYKEPYIFQAEAEEQSLSKLSVLDPDKCNVVKWHSSFIDRGHYCLEFEHLDKSLFDLMKERCFRPLLLQEIRPIVQQLANALDHLKRIGMIHADLKLENVMLVNHQQEPFKVKLIDFGLASDVSAAKRGSYIQTRPYRSPEIILGLPFTESVDMWSLGCVVAYLYLGTLLYDGRSEYDMMRCIVETQGQPPDNLLKNGLKTRRFFRRSHDSQRRLWELKSQKRFFHETGIRPVEARRLKLNSFDELVNMRRLISDNKADRIAEWNDTLTFKDILKGMLQLDAANRLTPGQVLEHPFISMRYISKYPSSSYVRTSFDNMGVCQDVIQTSGRGNAGGSLQQPSSRTAHPIQQNRPAPPAAAAGSNSKNQRQHINPHPCTSTQPVSAVKTGIKRKADEEGGTMKETAHQSKMVKTVHRESSAPSTSSINQDPTDNNQDSTALRGHPAHPHQQRVSKQPPQSSQALTDIKERVRRKLTDYEDRRRPQTKSDNRKKFKKGCAGPSTSSTSSRTRSVVSSTDKRKRAHGEDSGYDSSETSDRVRKRARNSNSQRSSHNLQDPPVRMNIPTNRPRPSTSTQPESQARSGLNCSLAETLSISPLFLKDLLHPYTPSPSLPSSDSGLLSIPHSRLRAVENRAFSVAAPTLWSSLPAEIRNAA